MITTWHAPLRDGTAPAEELLVSFDRGRAARVLVCPAWFDEANKLRRFTVEVMRRLDATGIDSLLPDLPGCNESLAPPENQTLEGWSSAMLTAAETLGVSHVLAIRAGALVVPPGLPGWRYASQSGPKLLRGMKMAVAEVDAEQSIGAPGGMHDLPCFGSGARQRLLTEDGQPVFECRGGLWHVQVIWRGDHDAIEIELKQVFKSSDTRCLRRDQRSLLGRFSRAVA